MSEPIPRIRSVSCLIARRDYTFQLGRGNVSRIEFDEDSGMLIYVKSVSEKPVLKEYETKEHLFRFIPMHNVYDVEYVVAPGEGYRWSSRMGGGMV